MGISSDEVFVTVFRRVMRDDLGNFSLDSHMLNVIMELDGKKSLAVVAEKMGLSLSIIRKVISKLLELRLVEPIQTNISMLDNSFLDCLNIQLSLAVGPIAEVLIEDAAADVGHNLSHFPTHRAAELVDLLARQIQSRDKRADFKQNMIKQIREQGQ